MVRSLPRMYKALCLLSNTKIYKNEEVRLKVKVRLFPGIRKIFSKKHHLERLKKIRLVIFLWDQLNGDPNQVRKSDSINC